jgi:hypothetical protein
MPNSEDEEEADKVLSGKPSPIWNGDEEEGPDDSQAESSADARQDEDGRSDSQRESDEDGLVRDDFAEDPDDDSRESSASAYDENED